MRRAAAAVLAALTFASCGGPPAPPVPTDSTFTMLAEGCAGDSCSGIRLSYPEYSGGEEGAAAAINVLIQRHLQSLVLIGDTTPISLERAARRLLEANRRFRADFPEAPGIWKVGARVTQTYASPAVITIRSDAVSDLGGAHPNSVTTFFMVEARTGRRLPDPEIIRDIPGLLRAAEPLFRDVRKLSADESLNDAGFWFPGDTLNLPANIGYTPEGLVLYYNRYEITSYAGGSTEVVVPWSTAADLVRLR